MIDVTVKTLDSQNHSYSVADDITVKEFKEKISASVNVPVDLQRLIYCGRVLQDDKKLNDYDVNGKVIHLVQRPPPTYLNNNDNRNNSSSTSNPSFPRFHNMRQYTTVDGNQVYVGAFSIPSDGDDMAIPSIQVPPVVSLGQSSSAVRLSQARRMLQKCNRLMDLLDHQNTDGSSSSPSNENTSMSNTNTESSDVIWTPNNISGLMPEAQRLILAARATAVPFVVRSNTIPNMPMSQDPGNSNPTNIGVSDTNSVNGTNILHVPASADLSASGLQNETFTGVTSSSTSGSGFANQTGIPATENSNSQVPVNSQSDNENENPAAHAAGSTSATPEESERREPTTTTNNDASNNDRLSRHPPTSTMVEVLDLLQNVDNRLQPYLREYYSLMQNDPPSSNEDEQRKNQSTFQKVSEIMHYLSHAYHAISDIMCDFTASPPRELRGRPFVIQQPLFDSAIPVQFDAQINVASNSSTDSERSPETREPQASQTPSSYTPGFMVMEMNSDGGNLEPSSASPNVTAGPQLLQRIIQMMRSGSIGMSISDSQSPFVQSGQTTQARSGSETTSTASTRTRTTPRAHLHPTAPMAFSLPGQSNMYDPFLQCSSHHWYPDSNRPRRIQTNPVIGATIDIHPVLNIVHGRQDTRPTVRISLGRQGEQSVSSSSNTTAPSARENNTSRERNSPGSNDQVPSTARQDIPSGDTPNVSSSDENIQGLNRQIQNIFQYIEGNLNNANMHQSVRVDGPRSNSISVSFSNINNQQTNDSASDPIPSLNNIIQSMLGPGVTEQITQLAQQFMGAGQESGITEPLSNIANVSVIDMENILSGNFQSLLSLLEPMRAYVRERILHGQEPTDSNIRLGMQNYLREWNNWFQVAEREARTQLSGSSPLDTIDFSATMENFLLLQSTEAIRSLFSSGNDSSSNTLHVQLQTFSDQLIALCLHCFNGSHRILLTVMERFLDLYVSGRGRLATNIANMFIRPRLHNLNLNVSTPTSDIQRYIVPRQQTEPSSTSVNPDLHDDMEVDDVPNGYTNGTNPSWQTLLPSDWVPIINQDICNQRRNSTCHQAPFSDAYLEGMPSKRRKMAKQNKPKDHLNHSLGALVKSSIRQLGFRPSTSDDQVLRDVAGNRELNLTYNNNLRSMIGKRIKNDRNYVPSKYPFTEDYVGK